VTAKGYIVPVFYQALPPEENHQEEVPATIVKIKVSNYGIAMVHHDRDIFHIERIEGDELWP
jgi:hypothetical protein